MDDRVQTLSIDTIRCLAMDAVQKANSGHPGTAMALAPVAYVLYTEAMRARPGRARVARSRPLRALGRARLHPPVRGAPPDGLRPHDGRPEAVPPVGVAHARDIPSCTTRAGVNVTTGPLGQGVGNAVGMAIAEQMLAARYNRDGHEVVNHRTFAICSDGDVMEGVSGEASSIAGFLGLGKLCLIYDDNHITIEGSTDLAFGEDVPARYEAYGCHVQRLDDTLDDRHAARRARRGGCRDRSPVLHRAAHAHRVRRPARAGHREGARRTARRGRDPPHQAGLRLGSRQALLRARRRLRRRWTSARAAPRPQHAWDERLAAYRAAHPELAAEFERVLAGKLPEGWEARAARPLRRRLAGDARELERVHPGLAATDARVRRRLGRSRPLDEHADRGRRLRSRTTRSRVATSTSASASTRWARS